MYSLRCSQRYCPSLCLAQVPGVDLQGWSSTNSVLSVASLVPVRYLVVWVVAAPKRFHFALRLAILWKKWMKRNFEVPRGWRRCLGFSSHDFSRFWHPKRGVLPWSRPATWAITGEAIHPVRIWNPNVGRSYFLEPAGFWRSEPLGPRFIVLHLRVDSTAVCWSCLCFRYFFFARSFLFVQFILTYSSHNLTRMSSWPFSSLFCPLYSTKV